jgi:hypothetical protein
MLVVVAAQWLAGVNLLPSQLIVINIELSWICPGQRVHYSCCEQSVLQLAIAPISLEVLPVVHYS